MEFVTRRGPRARIGRFHRPVSRFRSQRHHRDLPRHPRIDPSAPADVRATDPGGTAAPAPLRSHGRACKLKLIETGGLKRSLEALLFVASEALSIDAFVKLTGASHVEVAETLQAIGEDYAERGMVLREVAGGYRFASSPAARQAVEAYLLPAKTNLSPAAMESLAIVAYLQPVTKAEIEAVRGVNVDSVVGTLVDRRFIVEAGRRDVPAAPWNIKTTPEFLESFGLRSVAELPPVDLEAEALEIPLPIATEAVPSPKSARRLPRTKTPPRRPPPAVHRQKRKHSYPTAAHERHGSRRLGAHRRQRKRGRARARTHPTGRDVHAHRRPGDGGRDDRASARRGRIRISVKSAHRFR